MPTLSADVLCPLMGLTLDDPRVGGFIRGVGVNADIENFDPDIVASFASVGLSLTFDGEKRLAAAHLYRGDRDGFARFSGSLPGGVSFESSRIEVNRRLGCPERSSVGKPAWDRFKFAGCLVHAEYDSADTVALVTLMDPLTAP